MRPLLLIDVDGPLNPYAAELCVSVRSSDRHWAIRAGLFHNLSWQDAERRWTLTM